MSCIKGSKLSEEHKLNIGRANKGRKTWITGVGHSEETKKKISLGHMGIRHYPSAEARLKMSLKRRGKDNPNWRGGLASIQHILRESKKYKAWRDAVFKRDNFTCVVGGTSHGNKLNADHIKPFFMILRDLKITNTQDGFNCSELWDVNNGRTLCENCHKNTPSFGWKYLKLIK